MQIYVLSTLFTIYASSISKHFHVVVLSDGWPSYLHTFESNASLIMRVICYLNLKSKVLFCCCSIYVVKFLEIIWPSSRENCVLLFETKAKPAAR